MVTKPSRLRCACAGISTKSCRMPMTMPRIMPTRPNETLMRKSDLVMILSYDFLANDFLAIFLGYSVGCTVGGLSAGQVARDALFVAPICLAEFPFQVALFAPDDGEMQHDAARKDQQQKPIERKNQRDPAQRG